MADTFLARTIVSPTAPTVETLVYPGAAYLEHGCLLGLFNSFGSDRLLTVKCIDINEQLGRSTTAQVRCEFYRTTAQTDGEVVTPSRFDSNAAPLPAQVLVSKYPASVTTSGSAWRSINLLDSNIPTTALLGMNAVNNGGGGCCTTGLSQTRFETRDADVQGMILREGQGFCITTGLTSPSTFAMEVRVFFNVGSNTYLVSEVIPQSSHAPLFGLFNGSGSGVVITLARVEIRQTRTSDLLRLVTVERISGLYGGTALTPVPMDSMATALSSGVLLQVDGSATQANLDSNMGAQKKAGGDKPLRRLALPYFGVHPQLASLNIWSKQRVCDSMQTLGDIVLREGEGIGVFQRANACGRGEYEIMIGFNATVTATPSGGGETAYTF